MKVWILFFFILNINGVLADESSQKENESFEEKQQLWQQQLASFEKQGKIPEQVLEQANASVEDYQLKLKRLILDKDNAHQDMEESKKALIALKASLEELKKQSVDKLEDNTAGVETLQKQIKIQEERYDRAEKSIPETEKNLKELTEELKMAKLWQKQLIELNQKLQNQDLETRTKNLEKEYTESIQQLKTKLNNLSPDNLVEKNFLETQLINFQEQIQLNKRQLTLSKITNQLQSINSQLSQDIAQTSLEDWKKIIKNLEEHQQKLKTLQHVVQERLNILIQNNKLAENRLVSFNLYGKNQQIATEEKKLLDNLVSTIDNQQKTIIELEKSLEDYKETISNIIRELTYRDLFKQRQLPDTLKGWENLLNEALDAPEILWKQIQKAFLDGLYDLKRMSAGNWLIFSVFSLTILLVLNSLQKYIDDKILYLSTITIEDRSFLDNNLLIMFRLLKSNLIILTFGLILVALVFLADFNTSTIILVLGLTIVWLGIKLPINLAWELLVSHHIKEEYRDVYLYRQLRWMFLLIGLFSSITIVIHTLKLSPLIEEISDSIYMVFLMITVFPLIRIRNIFVRVMQEKQVRRYWILIFRLSTLLFPLSVLAMGILGMIGYINLAWKVAHILTWFAFVLTIWLICRGYVGDLFEYLKERARENQGTYSLLWEQDILPILYRIALVILFLIMLWVLLEGLSIDWAVFYFFLNYPVFVIDESTVKVGGIIFSLMVIITVVWLSKWIRRITYRWIYVNIADVGVRNSLAAFTQYTIVLIGFLIALQLMGIKLTTLTIFAGALGVGLGFGLQNIASNFISGLLLLVERPLKAGDIVLIGNYEGEVKNIGIRSLMIVTPDNKNVIIPNSELISRPFTNATRNDNKVRAVLEVGVSYENDPFKVKELLLDVLSKVPSVLSSPSPNVFLSSLGESAVIFKLQYYVDFKHGNSNLTKSEILFEIWEVFQKNNISMPYPQRDIHIRSIPPKLENKIEGIHC